MVLSTGMVHAQQLRWKFSSDDRFEVALNQRSLVSTMVSEREVAIENTVMIEVEWTVAEATSSEATIHQKIVRIQVATIPPESEDILRVDTREERPQSEYAGQLYDGLRPLIEQTFTARMSDRGEILDVVVPEETLEVLRQAPRSVRIRQLLTPEGLKEIYGQAVLVLPEESVQAGASWNSVRTFQIGRRTAKQSSEFTLVGPRRVEGQELLEIKSTSQFEIADDKGPISEREQASRFEIVEQMGEGTILFDAENGLLRESSMTSQLKTLTLYRELEIEGQVDSTLEVRISKRDP